MISGFQRDNFSLENLVWLGMAGMADPLRPDMDVLIERFHRAGIKTAMITGDQSATAQAEECEVQLSYSIGLAHPASLQVETFGTGKIDDDDIAQRLKGCFDFRVGGIIRLFDLRRLPSRFKGGFYQKLAAYGLMGRMDIGLPWERTDDAECLKD